MTIVNKTRHAGGIHVQKAIVEYAETNTIITNNLTMSACSSVPHPSVFEPSELQPNIVFDPHGLSDVEGAHQRSPRPLNQKRGRKTYRATRGVMIVMRTDDRRGRMMVQAKLELCPPEFKADNAGIIAASTSPMTSSMTAALMRTVPILVCCNGVGSGGFGESSFPWWDS